jgi:hypothetical protein
MVDATIYTTLITVDSVFDLTQVAGNIDTENSRLSAGEVIFTSSGSLPPGSGSDPTYFQSRYYVIDVTAEGPNRASSRVEAQVARIVPK